MASFYGYSPPGVSVNGEVNTFSDSTQVNPFRQALPNGNNAYIISVALESGPLELLNVPPDLEEVYSMSNVAATPMRTVLFTPKTADDSTYENYNKTQLVAYSMPLEDPQNLFRMNVLGMYTVATPSSYTINADDHLCLTGPSAVNTDSMTFQIVPHVAPGTGAVRVYERVYTPSGGSSGFYKYWNGIQVNSAIHAALTYYEGTTRWLLGLTTEAAGGQQTGWGITDAGSVSNTGAFTVAVAVANAADRVYPRYGLCSVRGAARMITASGKVYRADGGTLVDGGTLNGSNASTLLGVCAYDNDLNHMYALYKRENNNTLALWPCNNNDVSGSSIEVTLVSGDQVTAGAVCMVTEALIAVAVVQENGTNAVRLVSTASGTIIQSLSVPSNGRIVSLGSVSRSRHEFWAWSQESPSSFTLGALRPSVSSPSVLLFFPQHNTSYETEAWLTNTGLTPNHVLSRATYDETDKAMVRILSAQASFATTLRRPGGYTAPALVVTGPDALEYPPQRPDELVTFDKLRVEGAHEVTSALFYSPYGTLGTTTIPTGWQVSSAIAPLGGSAVVAHSTTPEAKVEDLNDSVRLQWSVVSGQQSVQAVFTDTIERDVTVDGITTSYTPAMCSDGSGVGFLVPSTFAGLAGLQRVSLEDNTITRAPLPTEGLTNGPFLYPIASNTLNLVMFATSSTNDAVALVRLEFDTEGAVEVTLIDPSPSYETYTSTSHTASYQGAIWVSPVSGNYIHVDLTSYYGPIKSNLGDQVDGDTFGKLESVTSSGTDAAVLWSGATSGTLYLSRVRFTVLDTSVVSALPAGRSITASTIFFNHVVAQLDDGSLSFFDTSNPLEGWVQRFSPQTVGHFDANGFTGGPTADTVLGWWKDTGGTTSVYSILNMTTGLRLPLSSPVAEPFPSSSNGCAPGSGTHMIGDHTFVSNGAYAPYTTSLRLLAEPEPTPTVVPPTPVKPGTGLDAIWCAIIVCLIFLVAGSIALPCALKPV